MCAVFETSLCGLFYAPEVMVLMDFEGNEVDELTVHVGDLVKNVSKAAEDGWLQGELRGVRGIFPANFVKVCVWAQSLFWRSDVPLRPTGPEDLQQPMSHVCCS